MTPDLLLRELSANGASSGAALAARFGVSRAAVWKQVQRLRALGVAIEGAAGSGYRLLHPVELLDQSRLARELPHAARAFMRGIEVHWELDSTSAELMRRGSGDAHGIACLAEHQSAGRGRRGRAWQSPLAGGLYLSLGWRFDAGISALSGLSLVVGVATVQALEETLAATGGALLAPDGKPELGLKWPNDVHARGRKLGGILIELSGELGGPCDAVVGIGLNWRLHAAAGAGIDQPWIDLATLLPDALPSRNSLALALIARVSQALARFGREGLAPFLPAFQRLDLLRDREVSVDCGGERIEGVALGVDTAGLLRVRSAGRERRVGSGEVSVRPRA